MMKQDVLIKANSKNGRVELPTARLGINGENLQGNIIIEFIDEFIDGSAVLELKRKNEKYYLVMNKENNKYTLPILSSLLTETCVIDFQLRITVGTGENVPVWKSNIFYLKVEEAINSTTTIPEEYESWIDIANEKLNEIDESIQEVDNIDIDVNKVGNTATVSITKKDGTEKSVEIYDGLKGEKGDKGDTGERGPQGLKGDTGSAGADAKINGVNTLTIEAGTNITLDQEGNILTISSTGGGGGGTSNYNALTNKPKINNVELNGNKSLNELGIQPAGNYLTEETDPTVPSYVKNITQANITNWNNKSDFSGNYNDLTNKPTIPSEVTETTVSNWGFTKNIGTITGITMNGVSKGTSGVVDLGTVITSHQDISGKANKISVVQSSASTIEINSNTFYKFGEVASLTITLASITDNTIYNEYMFEFVSGTTATTLTLPSSIKWLETPTIDANKIYQCSIVDNVGLLVGVTNV